MTGEGCQFSALLIKASFEGLEGQEECGEVKKIRTWRTGRWKDYINLLETGKDRQIQYMTPSFC